MASGSRRLELDGIRGIAIAMVLVLHFCLLKQWGGEAWVYYIDKVRQWSEQGVDIFFVLSGFLIGGILLEYRASPRLFSTFYFRRFLRIVPVYWLLLISFVGAAALQRYFGWTRTSYLDDPNPLPVWRYVLFLQNAVMAWKQSLAPTWLVVTWSLAVEEQFYLLAPLLVRMASRRLFVACCVGALGMCPILRFVYAVEAHNTIAAMYLLVCRADALSAGILAAMIVRAAPGWLRHNRARLGVASTAFVLTCVSGAFVYSVETDLGGVIYPSIYALGNACVLLWLAAQPDAMLARALRWRPLVALGNVSYFVYLFHLPFVYAALTLARHWSHQYDAFAVLFAIGLTIVAGGVSRRVLELPCIRFGRKAWY